MNLLLAGRGTDPMSGVPLMSDLEALQTVSVLYDVFVPAGLSGKAASFWAWGARLLNHICNEGPPGTGPLDNPQPAISIRDWLYRDILLRCHWSMAIVDLDRAYYLRREPSMNFFARTARCNLPWHDIYYFDPDPAKAFRAMQLNAHTVPVGPDLRGFAREPTEEMAMLTSNMFIEPVFSFRAGIFGTLALNNFLIVLTDRLRKFAERRRVRGLEVMAKATPSVDANGMLTPPMLSAKEQYFMERVHLFDRFCYGCFYALPHGIGRKILEGDADAFFQVAPNYFADTANSNYLAAILLNMLSRMIQNRFHGGGNPDPVALFCSPEFAKVLETAAIFTAILRAQLRHDPQIDGVAYLPTVPVLRIGALQIALLAGLPEHAPERALLANDLATTVAYFQIHARRAGPAGHQIAANFTAGAASVGVFVDTGATKSGLTSIDDDVEEQKLLKHDYGSVKLEASVDALAGSGNDDAMPQQQQPGLAEVVLGVDEMTGAWYEGKL